MFDLQLLVSLLHATKFFELCGNLFIDSYTFSHDHTLARLFAPTRQHERMDVKRLSNVTHRDTRQLAQTDGCRLEFLGVFVGGARAWFRHGVDS
jgi:hypothetical protein